MKNLNALDWVSLILVVVGGINWGLVGFLNFDLVANILGEMTLASRMVYDLVGLASLYLLFMLGNLAKK